MKCKKVKRLDHKKHHGKKIVCKRQQSCLLQHISDFGQIWEVQVVRMKSTKNPWLNQHIPEKKKNTVSVTKWGAIQRKKASVGKCPTALPCHSPNVSTRRWNKYMPSSPNTGPQVVHTHAIVSSYESITRKSDRLIPPVTQGGVSVFCPVGDDFFSWPATDVKKNSICIPELAPSLEIRSLSPWWGAYDSMVTIPVNKFRAGWAKTIGGLDS